MKKKGEGAKAPSSAISPSNQSNHFYGKLLKKRKPYLEEELESPVELVKKNIYTLMLQLKQRQSTKQRLFVFSIDDLIPAFSHTAFRSFWKDRNLWVPYVQNFLSTATRGGMSLVVFDYQKRQEASVYNRLEVCFRRPETGSLLPYIFITKDGSDSLLNYPKWITPWVLDKETFSFWEEEGYKPVADLDSMSNSWKKSFQNGYLTREWGKNRTQTVIASVEFIKSKSNDRRTTSEVIGIITKNTRLIIV
jgi:hypothetical protein